MFLNLELKKTFDNSKSLYVPPFIIHALPKPTFSITCCGLVLSAVHILKDIFSITKSAWHLKRNFTSFNYLLSNLNIIINLYSTVLLKIFSYLDDISLCNVSEVCKQWRKILETHIPQSMWKKYTKERWPLFQHVGYVSNWFQVNKNKT